MALGSSPVIPSTPNANVLQQEYNLPKDTAKHLLQTYGDRAEIVAQLSQLGFSKRLHPDFPYIEAEVIFAVKIQSAITPMDVLARRTRLSFLNSAAAKSAIPRVVEIMGDLNDWSPERRQEEIKNAEALLSSFQQ